MNKQEIAEILEEIADLLEMKSENRFRVRAYRNAARALLNTERDLGKMIREGTLTELEGIGDDLAGKITELRQKGRLPFYEKLKRSVPKALLELRQVQGLGPKKAQALYEKLKVRSVADLKKACESGKVAKLAGFGAKTAKKLLVSLEHKESYQKRHLWWDAMQAAAPILRALKKIKGVRKAEIAGSVRRKLETVGDLDFIVAASDPKPVMNWFTTHSAVASVLAKGDTKSSVRLEGGMQADLRVVEEEQFAPALFYSTGSKEHNIKIRQRSLKKGWSLSEYGFKLTKPPSSEEALYRSLDLSYIPPELRENTGEIEAAEKGKLPKLIEEKDIKGSFHNHTTESDGRSNLGEMIAAAQKLGWEYIGISDHSKSSVQANGLSVERLLRQIEQIRKLNASKKFKPYIFTGTECDILTNGELDFDDEILSQLDYVIVSIHSSLTQSEKTTTGRLIRAIEHPLTTMVGHLTGRLLLKRAPYALNAQKVIDACIANKKIIEINGNPQRLDMDWRLWHAASEKGLLTCINADAHSADQLQFVDTGVNIARKGWLEKKHVLNTLPLSQIKKFLKKTRS